MISRVLIVMLAAMASYAATYIVIKKAPAARDQQAAPAEPFAVSTIELKQIKCEEKKVAKFTVRNNTKEALRIVGFETSCSCTSVDKLPDRLMPLIETAGEVTIVAPDHPGKFSGTVSLFTDNVDHRTIKLRYEGEAME